MKFMLKTYSTFIQHALLVWTCYTVINIFFFILKTFNLGFLKCVHHFQMEKARFNLKKMSEWFIYLKRNFNTDQNHLNNY